MTSFILKIIACVTMFCDHFGYSLLGKFSFFNYIGRIAFPIFAFQITEGYSHTKNIKKYFLKLLLFALVSQIPFMLFSSIVSTKFSLNVMFALLLGLFSIFVYDKFSNKIVGLFALIICSIIAQVSNMDYGYWGVLLVFVFYLFNGKKAILAYSFIALVFIEYLPNLVQYNFYYKYIIMLICTCLSIIPILFYNGKQGKKVKYFLYIFYPLHLLFLYCLYCFLH